MATAIEAGSLATVMDLADNPPDHPQHDPTLDLQKPLILYIARVPGSRDVFLTLIKPLQKIVTAQDIQSSLYYVHVDNAQVDALLTPLGANFDEAEGVRATPEAPFANVDSVRRKPLPLDRDLGSASPPALPPRHLSHNSQAAPNVVNSFQLGRKPVGSSSRLVRQDLDNEHPRLDRKALGPRPLQQRFRSVDSPKDQASQKTENLALGRSLQSPSNTPKLPPRTQSANIQTSDGAHSEYTNFSPASQGSAIHSYEHYAEHYWNWEKDRNSEETTRRLSSKSKYHELRGAFQDISLSMIRRYNGEQWNVGKILDRRKGVTPEATADMSLVMATPGYAKFDVMKPTHHDVKSDANGFGGTLSGSGSEKISLQTDDRESSTICQRRLQLSDLTNGLAEQVTRSTNMSFTRQLALQDLDLSETSQHASDALTGHRLLSSKRYVFESPWRGVCEFTSGVAGRSLKCKHTYDSSDPNYGHGSFTTTVSELRFNLPSSKMLGTSAPKVSKTRETKRSSIFLKDHLRRPSSSFEPMKSLGDGRLAPQNALQDRLDLSLGQEHAGGGFGGKQAKLGKLIVEPGGLQMLDLVVAANIALWWRVYEKVI